MSRKPIKDMTGRFGTHYESLPHDNCYDPERCDCECFGCIKDYSKTAAGRRKVAEALLDKLQREGVFNKPAIGERP